MFLIVFVLEPLQLHGSKCVGQFSTLRMPVGKPQRDLPGGHPERTPTGYIAVGCHMHGISSRGILLQLDASMWLRPFPIKRMPDESFNDIIL